MSVGDALRRPTFNHEGSTFDSPDLEKVGAVDITEIADFVEQQNQHVAGLQQKLSAQQKAEKLSAETAEQNRLEKLAEKYAAKNRAKDSGRAPNPQSQSEGGSEANE